MNPPPGLEEEGRAEGNSKVDVILVFIVELPVLTAYCCEPSGHKQHPSCLSRSRSRALRLQPEELGAPRVLSPWHRFLPVRARWWT